LGNKKNLAGQKTSPGQKEIKLKKKETKNRERADTLKEDEKKKTRKQKKRHQGTGETTGGRKKRKKGHIGIQGKTKHQNNPPRKGTGENGGVCNRGNVEKSQKPRVWDPYGRTLKEEKRKRGGQSPRNTSESEKCVFLGGVGA